MKLKTIPKGDYCYVFNGKNGRERNGTPYMGIDICPHYSSRNIGGVPVPYCKFLKEMGIPDCKDDDWKKVVKYFGSKNEAFKVIKLNLLWDKVKECGENK